MRSAQRLGVPTMPTRPGPLGTDDPKSIGQNTFSFLGVQFDGELIFRVRITTGDQVLSQTNIGLDQVVLDDFIFSEPQAVPEPSPVCVVGLAAATCAMGRRRHRRANSVLEEVSFTAVIEDDGARRGKK